MHIKRSRLLPVAALLGTAALLAACGDSPRTSTTTEQTTTQPTMVPAPAPQSTTTTTYKSQSSD